MVITPQSEVILLKCPLELSQDNQINFANATAQYNYFYGLPKRILSQEEGDFTYVRKDGVIRVPASYDDLAEYNYAMYRNKAYSNKWFYAFVGKMEYINDTMTAVPITTDCFQTWQFDLEYKRTFVEREHVNDDTVGLHTLPEGLDTGEYEIQDLRNIPMYETQTAPNQAWFVCFCVSKLPGGISTFNGESSNIGGVYSGLHIFAVSSFLAARSYINALTYEGSETTQDSIINMYMIPRCCVNINENDWTELADGTKATTIGPHGEVAIYPVYQFWNSDNDIIVQQPSTTSGGYQPVNKKLLTWPFSYFYLSNNAGEDVEYKYEDFPFETISGNYARTIRFAETITPSAGMSAKLYPKKYKNYTSGNAYGTYMMNYGVNYAKAPTCAWSSDYWLNWQTQNGVNIAGTTVSAAMSAGMGILSANPISFVGGTVSAINQISGLLGEMYKAYKTPPQAHGDVATGDAVFCEKRCSISMYKMSIRPEVARVIDSFFSMFGYKVSEVKIPNITGRQNWNYVKTVNCYIQADIPQEDLQTIKDMFDRGLTIWHNPSTFMDYSQSNAIVS